MTGNITKRDIERAVRAAGGTLEEDEGYRTMRVFQAVAPDGKRWQANSCVYYRVEFDTYPGKQAEKYNLNEWKNFCSALAMLLEDIPAEELDQYATD